eukprot:scaffold927_cov135-Isochrysis_galbana.AAC.4
MQGHRPQGGHGHVRCCNLCVNRSARGRRGAVAHSVPLAASGTDICGAAVEPELFVAQCDVPCKATDPRAAMDTPDAATYACA